MLVLWECFLERFVRDAPLLTDPNMKKLWIDAERWLLTQFPQIEKIATPFSDPLFSIREYQEFLHSLGYLGYISETEAAFSKLMK